MPNVCTWQQKTVGRGEATEAAAGAQSHIAAAHRQDADSHIHTGI